MLLQALLLLQAAAAAPAACPATPAPLPAGLGAWSPISAVAPIAAAAATPVAIPVGRGFRAALLPAAAVKLAVPTSKPAAPGSSAGVYGFTIATAGRYRVSLGAGAWVDVVAGSKALTSVAHGHGPACSPIRKIVDFDLKPGSYLLQIVGSTAPTIGVMVAPAR